MTPKRGSQHHRRGGAFTLVEILIVVLILGVLAAIVIPRFANASVEAKRNGTLSSLNTVRGQIELYMLQHGDSAPDFTTYSDWEQLVQATDARGRIGAKGAEAYGPYMQSRPVNPLNGPPSMWLVHSRTNAPVLAS